MKCSYFIIFLFSFLFIGKAFALDDSLFKSKRPETPAEYEAKKKQIFDTLKSAAKTSKNTPE